MLPFDLNKARLDRKSSSSGYGTGGSSNNTTPAVPSTINESSVFGGAGSSITGNLTIDEALREIVESGLVSNGQLDKAKETLDKVAQRDTQVAAGTEPNDLIPVEYPDLYDLLGYKGRDLLETVIKILVLQRLNFKPSWRRLLV